MHVFPNPHACVAVDGVCSGSWHKQSLPLPPKNEHSGMQTPKVSLCCCSFASSWSFALLRHHATPPSRLTVCALQREEPIAPPVVPWTGSTQSPRVSTGYASTPAEAAATEEDVDLQQLRQQEERTREQEREPQQAQQQTTMSDFSSLYSPHGAVSEHD